MNTGLLDQFMLWNGSLNTACCLIQFHDNNTFSIVAANTALNKILNSTVDFTSLEILLTLNSTYFVFFQKINLKNGLITIRY